MWESPSGLVGKLFTLTPVSLKGPILIIAAEFLWNPVGGLCMLLLGRWGPEIHSLSYLFCSEMSLHSLGHRYRKMPEKAQARWERHTGIFWQLPQVSPSYYPEVTAMEKAREIRDASQSRLMCSCRLKWLQGLDKVIRQGPWPFFWNWVHMLSLGFLSLEYKKI